MKEVSSVNRKNALPLALLLATLTPTTPPAAAAHDHGSHASGGQKRQTSARRRPAKRRRNVRKQNAQKQQAMYTCPMHHEVRSRTPGECPKCRMELELEETPARAKSE
jgi:hypothetical protein